MKLKIHSIALSGMAILFMASCSSPAVAPVAIDMDNLKVEIQKMEDAYAAAEKAKDADGVAAYYSDDAISYSRGKEPFEGKAAIRAQIADRLAKDTSGITNVYKIVDLYAAGELAVEIGSWQEINPAGQEVKSGHYMSYFEKRDGKYICVRDMNVNSKPDVTNPAKEGM